MSLKRRRSSSPGSSKGDGSALPKAGIFISEPIEDRTSTFVAYFSPTIPSKELQKQDNIREASHRMLAWRRKSTQRTLGFGQHAIETGHDDDGERYGGKRILQVLEQMKVEGSLVVARWYGGIMLGPVRFTHIENCAREVIGAWQQHEQAEVQKKRRLEAETAEQARLVEELKERDGSVAALRVLLEQKTASVGGKNGTTGEKATTASQGDKATPTVQAVDYAALPVERLRMLDTARDRTIAFLLKRIDAVEKEQKAASPAKAIPGRASPGKASTSTPVALEAATETAPMKTVLS